MITDYSIQAVAINAIPLIFAITIHEAAHGYAARKFGDNTAYMLGRVSLNPAKHIDPVGTILIPLALILVGSSFLVGYAKLSVPNQEGGPHQNQCQRNQDSSYRVNMFGGIETNPPQHICRVIPKFSGSVSMGCFVDRNGKNQGNRINGDSLDRIVGNHGNMISIGAQSD